MAWTSEQDILDYSGMTIRAANFETDGTPTMPATVTDLTVSDDLTVGDDAAVVGLMTVGETLDVTGAFSAPSMFFNGTTVNGATLKTYQTTVTVDDGQTTGVAAAIVFGDNFIPLAVQPNVTVAATNAVNLTDIGDEGDTDSYVDTIAVAVNTTGRKRCFSCNGLNAFPGGTSNTGALTTADEVMVTLSGDPGATGCTMILTFVGIEFADL